MGSLFSEFFNKFGGAFLEVCESIQGHVGRHVRGILEGFRGIKCYYSETHDKRYYSNELHRDYSTSRVNLETTPRTDILRRTQICWRKVPNPSPRGETIRLIQCFELQSTHMWLHAKTGVILIGINRD